MSTLRDLNPFHTDPNKYDARTESQEPDAPHVGMLLEHMAELHARLAAARPQYEYTGPRTFGGPSSDSAPAGTMANPFAGPCEVAILSCNIASGAGLNLLAVSTSPNLNPLQIAAVDGVSVLQGDIPFLYLAYTSTNAPGILAWHPLSGNDALYLYAAATGGGAKGCYATVQFRRRVNPAGVPNVGFP